ncbi:hypothetical protein EGW08_011484, partial [Elysia chlorotica]
MAFGRSNRKPPNQILCLFIVLVIVASLIWPLLLIAYTRAGYTRIYGAQKPEILQLETHASPEYMQEERHVTSAKDENETDTVLSDNRTDPANQNSVARLKDDRKPQKSKTLAKSDAISMLRSYKRLKNTRENKPAMASQSRLKSTTQDDATTSYGKDTSWEIFNAEYRQMNQDDSDFTNQLYNSLQEEAAKNGKKHLRLKRDADGPGILNQTGSSDECVTMEIPDVSFKPVSAELVLVDTKTGKEESQARGLVLDQNYTQCGLKIDHAYNATLIVKGQNPDELGLWAGTMITTHRFPIAPDYFYLIGETHITLIVRLPKLAFYDSPDTSRVVTIKSNDSTEEEDPQNSSGGLRGQSGDDGSPFIKPAGRRRRGLGDMPDTSFGLGGADGPNSNGDTGNTDFLFLETEDRIPKVNENDESTITEQDPGDILSDIYTLSSPVFDALENESASDFRAKRHIPIVNAVGGVTSTPTPLTGTGILTTPVVPAVGDP